MCGAGPATFSPIREGAANPTTVPISARAFASHTSAVQPSGDVLQTDITAADVCASSSPCGDIDGRGDGSCCRNGFHKAKLYFGTPPDGLGYLDAAAELAAVRQERDDALHLVKDLAARAAGLIVELDERCIELSHVRFQRDMLRRQLEANRVAVIHCFELIAAGRWDECVEVALAVAGLRHRPCRPSGTTAAAAEVPMELQREHDGGRRVTMATAKPKVP
ncbi:hypothetical protein Vretimale_16897 [Volvox reticuliferus]|uniref:Uncharacterized protein n=1 Tax=Volvox reticuliferus TaxID=1737510 RepID=A0A8J4CUF8_9CHLO|nr:hypothetical protein Vretifemale_16815 [Volvox reticuliferus]GIM13828.1 hypothetical protein Vretimale_16897 [Volvox reticuliferus]